MKFENDEITGTGAITALVLAFVLIFQSFLLPIAKVRAAEAAAFEQALTVICTSLDAHADGSGDQQPAAHCELPCCLPSHRFDLAIDMPALVAVISILIAPQNVAAPRAPLVVSTLRRGFQIAQHYSPRAPPAFS
jgi:hypothetical protein